MNQASTKISTEAGRAQMNTDCTACAMARNTSCLAAAGSALTVAGLPAPPGAAAGPPARGRPPPRLGQLPAEHGAERGHPERAADLLEEHPGAAGHAHVPLLHAVLRDQRDHLHQEAHAQAEDHV